MIRSHPASTPFHAPPPLPSAVQAPKPILLDVGLTKPIEFVSYILPLQIARIGNIYIGAFANFACTYVA